MSAIEVKIPPLGESVNEGVIARWTKGDGDLVRADETLLELETDKAVMEIPAEGAGRLEILVPEGETVQVGQPIAKIHPEAAPPAAPPSEPAAVEAAPAETEAVPPPALSPAARKLVAEHGLDPAQIRGTGKDGRLTKADVLAFLERRQAQQATAEAVPATKVPPEPVTDERPVERPPAADEGRGTRRVPMSRLRQRIAERLVAAQREAAILTTFNDIDMSAVLELRRRYRERFEQKHGVRLGFMALFGRACVLALQEIPELNAAIEGTDIVYHDRVHLGIAVSSERGLVVPVVREADRMTLAELERAIARLAERARANRLTPDELSGGTFSLSNGGVFGSLLSTPILNPPQSGILGMHRIEERPVAVEGRVEIRPMMYVALSYDHRLVDGREAVTFLKRVKEYLEDPQRMVLEI